MIRFVDALGKSIAARVFSTIDRVAAVADIEDATLHSIAAFIDRAEFFILAQEVIREVITGIIVLVAFVVRAAHIIIAIRRVPIPASEIQAEFRPIAEEPVVAIRIFVAATGEDKSKYKEEEVVFYITIN